MDQSPQNGRRGPNGNGHKGLTKDECLHLLRSKYVGRLGYVNQHRPVIVPVNYRVDDDGAVFFMTANGPKLEAASHGGTLCLEADESDLLSKSGWSVLVTGRASVVDEDDAQGKARDLRLRAWPRDVPCTQLVKIEPERVEGRRLRT